MLSVSIAMCTYNGSRYLERQLQSIRNQSVNPLEVVICDDGSSDDTESIIIEFSRRSSFPIKYYKNEEKLGYRKNFIKAAEKCSGDLIAFCDQDDIWMPDKIEMCARIFENKNILLVYHEINIIDINEKFIKRYSDRAPPCDVMEPLTMTPWLYAYGFTQMIRRSLCSYNSLWDLSSDQNDPGQKLAHDQYYIFLSSVIGSIAYISEPLAGYRQHESNLFGVKDTSERGVSLRQKLDLKSNEFRRCSISSASRSAILQQISTVAKGEVAARSVRGYNLYANLSSLYEKRAAMYQAKSRRSKLALMMKIMRQGGYKNERPWSFGRKAFLKDLAICAM